MAELIQIPSIEGVNLDDWQALILRGTDQSSGFISLGLENMDNLAEPAISAGSRLEVNRGLYQCKGIEQIENLPTSGTRRYFIYAIPSDQTDPSNPPNVQEPSNSILTFECKDDSQANYPIWNASKGGWYRPSSQDRAIATFYYSAGQYQNKAILDNFNAMNNPLIQKPAWQRGFMKLNLSNMYNNSDQYNNSVKPQILAGSIIEINGVMFEIDHPTDINDTSGSAWGIRYILAIIIGNDVMFNFDTATGVQWYADKNAWYMGWSFNRVIAKCYSDGTNYNGKVIINSFSDMSTTRTDIIPRSEGNKIIDFNSNHSSSVAWDVSPKALGNINSGSGMYYYVIKGASSGIPYPSSPRQEGYEITGYFVWDSKAMTYGIGQFGGNATYSNNIAYGGGGMSFVGPIIAHGGKPGATMGTAASGVYGGIGGSVPPNTTDAILELWRCW